MIRMIKITPKSECGAGEVGEIKLHGAYYPVISLRNLFGFPDREPLLSDNLVIVDTGISSLALWVDETYIIEEGDFSIENQACAGHLQTILPGVRIIRQDLIIIEDLLQFIPFSKKDQVKLVDILYPHKHIAGICSVRGEIISLVDLRALFSIPERGLTDLNRVIVLTDNSLTFGILADQITGIGTVNTDELYLPDGDYSQDLYKYLQGIKGSLFVLNAEALLTDPRMVIDDTEN